MKYLEYFRPLHRLSVGRTSNKITIARIRAKARRIRTMYVQSLFEEVPSGLASQDT